MNTHICIHKYTFESPISHKFVLHLFLCVIRIVSMAMSAHILEGEETANSAKKASKTNEPEKNRPNKNKQKRKPTERPTTKKPQITKTKGSPCKLHGCSSSQFPSSLQTPQTKAQCKGCAEGKETPSFLIVILII